MGLSALGIGPTLWAFRGVAFKGNRDVGVLKGQGLARGRLDITDPKIDRVDGHDSRPLMKSASVLTVNLPPGKRSSQ